jgi:hypothetical protein
MVTVVRQGSWECSKCRGIDSTVLGNSSTKAIFFWLVAQVGVGWFSCLNLPTPGRYVSTCLVQGEFFDTEIEHHEYEKKRLYTFPRMLKHGWCFSNTVLKEVIEKSIVWEGSGRYLQLLQCVLILFLNYLTLMVTLRY